MKTNNLGALVGLCLVHFGLGCWALVEMFTGDDLVFIGFSLVAHAIFFVMGIGHIWLLCSVSEINIGMEFSLVIVFYVTLCVWSAIVMRDRVDYTTTMFAVFQFGIVSSLLFTIYLASFVHKWQTLQIVE
jgi:hypothetical protein